MAHPLLSVFIGRPTFIEPVGDPVVDVDLVPRGGQLLRGAPRTVLVPQVILVHKGLEKKECY